MSTVYKILLLILLIYSSYTDIKTKKVMMVPVWGCALIAIIEIIFPTEEGGMSFLGALPGMIFLIISFVTKGALGSGDAYLAIVIGMFLGAKNTVIIFMIASVLAAVYSLIMLAAKRIDRKGSIPFVPFILSGYLGILVLGENVI